MRPPTDVAALLIAPIAPGDGPGPALPSVDKATGSSVDTGVKPTDQPEELIPQVAKKRPPKVEKTKPSKRLRPGDLVCGECGEGNSPTRKFCSRCGSSLETAVKVKTPWWRRIIPKRKPKTLEAGARPGQAGVKGKRKAPKFKTIFRNVRRVGALILMLCGILYAIYTPFREGVNRRYTSAKNRVVSVLKPQFTAVTPVRVDVSSQDPSAPDNDKSKIFDLANNTFWQADPNDPRPTVIVEFDHSTDLKKMIITSGDSAEFAKKARPRVIHILYSNDESQDITIEDKSEPQTITLKHSDNITALQMQVTEEIPVIGNPDAPMAITEIEFRVKK